MFILGRFEFDSNFANHLICFFQYVNKNVPADYKKMFPLTINNYMETKKCKLCEKEKGLNEFYLCAGKYSSRCKKCFNEYQKNNPNRKGNQNRYGSKNRDIINSKTRERYHKNVDESRKSNREKRKRLRKLNPEKYRNYSNKWRNNNYERVKKDLEWKMKKILRTRFLTAIKKQFKKSSVLKLLGCSIDECRIYIESKFQEGMNWENHGIFGWHIDHIIPCATFDLTKLEEQQKCFHYTNLQPLWWEDNLKKSNKVEEGKPLPSS
jgi:hypothetical protein